MALRMEKLKNVRACGTERKAEAVRERSALAKKAGAEPAFLLQ
jgi:hypothetical protein